MSSRVERISLSNVVASCSFQNILSVLYKYGLSRFVEDYGERIIEDWINVRYCFVPRFI